MSVEKIGILYNEREVHFLPWTPSFLGASPRAYHFCHNIYSEILYVNMSACVFNSCALFLQLNVFILNIDLLY